MVLEDSSENSSPVTEFHYLHLLATAIKFLFFRPNGTSGKTNLQIELIYKLRKVRDHCALALKSFRIGACVVSYFS